ncbi:MAG: hypothetical protein B7Y95_13880 [Rhizobiales bacterium 32-66-11]|nr:MAG: hypothetical protein B7Y95_13880 [Rhizobiales bacterium 32-66-11]
MNNKPRVHHFVPQFWIKKFRDSDGKLQGYSWDDDRIKERAAKAVMQIFDLYTIQPSGADDTTLETGELGDIDRNSSAAFERVLAGDHSEAAKVELANFLAAQVMRDPQIIASYKPKTQEYALALLGALDAPDYGSFLASLSLRFPGADLKEVEYDYIRGLGPACAEKEIEKIITALDAIGGLPELPFTDLVRDPSGRDIVRAVLLGFDWQIKIDSSACFVLGDVGILYNGRDLGSGLKAPLSDTTALYLAQSTTPTQGITVKPAEPFEVQNLNLESAARTRRWLVGDPHQLAQLKGQLSSQGFPPA